MKIQGLSSPSSSFNWIFSVTKKFWIILGVVLWLYFVISHIPAVWGAYLLTRGGDVGMSGVSGTLWSGRASLASIKVKQSDYPLGQLSWKLNGWSLLLLKPCADIETVMDNQNISGHICLGFNGAMDIANANISFPARMVQPQLPLPVDGKFVLRIESMSMKDNQLNQLQGKMSWTEAKVHNGTNWMEMGGFGADLSDDGSFGINAHVFAVNSPVNVDINVAMVSPSGTFIKGKVSMSEAFAQQSNASAWITMFASATAPDDQGNLQYTVDMGL